MENKNRPLLIAAVMVFLLLFSRLIQLQLIEGGKHRQMAEENAARTIPSPAARGVIYDRRGQPLVVSRPVFSVQVMPSILASGDTARREAVLDRLSRLLGEKVEFKVSADRPIIIKDNVQLETALRVEELNNELEGVVISVRPVRHYPRGGSAAHLLGYVGEIEADDLVRLKEEGYHLGDSVGKDGVEKYYDKLIRGIDGGKKIEVDVHGRPRRIIDSLDSVPGADLTLTIDADLQAAAEKELAGRAGAVVVLNPRSGEILALASQPNYDPNLFINPLDIAKWQRLAGGRHPFMNRALAIYPPGSTFKAITLAAALEEKVARPNETLYCPGYYRINNRLARCWKEGGHGRITVKEGLTQSCDVVFYELGKRLGPEKLAAYAKSFGLGEKSGIDLPQEKRGLVPTPAWKAAVWKEPWYEGDSINYGIGQGFLQVTPLQLALVYGEVASGKLMRPYVVSAIKSREGKVLYQAQSQEVGPVPVSQENLKIIREALFDVVDRATGIAAKIAGLPAAGKTGTAENPGLPHAWFVCYAPFEKPEIVIAAFVEHGEHGDRAAAGVARGILTWYRDNRLLTAADKSDKI